MTPRRFSAALLALLLLATAVASPGQENTSQAGSRDARAVLLEASAVEPGLAPGAAAEAARSHRRRHAPQVWRPPHHRLLLGHEGASGRGPDDGPVRKQGLRVRQSQ